MENLPMPMATVQRPEDYNHVIFELDPQTVFPQPRLARPGTDGSG